MVAIKFDRSEPTAPPTRFFSITPHNTNPLAEVTRAIYVGGAGDITLRGVDDSSDVVFKAVPVGVTIVGQFSHVRATGTTATYLLGQA